MSIMDKESNHTDVCMVRGHDLQNPELVALKEDIKRTDKKIKLWERELEDRKTRLSDQHSKVAKLEQDFEQVNAGEPVYCLQIHASGTCTLALGNFRQHSCHCQFAWHNHVQGKNSSPDTSPELQVGTWCSMHGGSINSCFYWPLHGPCRRCALSQSSLLAFAHLSCINMPSCW